MRGRPFYPVCVQWRNRVDSFILISGERYPMRLLVASDLHGSPEAAAFLRRRCEELLPDMLVLLGDYLYHGPRNPLPSSYGPPSVVSVFADFDTPIVAVRGNCDAEVDLMLLPFAVEDSAVIAADGLRIVAQHGHHLPSCPPHSRCAPRRCGLERAYPYPARGNRRRRPFLEPRQHNAAQGRLSGFLWRLRSRCVPCVRA